MNIQISRRDALLGSGALVVSFALAGSSTGSQAQGSAKPLALTEVDSFLAIDKTGKVTVYSGKVDLGTGITTALRQIVADELDVPMNRIELVAGRHLAHARPGQDLGAASPSKLAACSCVRPPPLRGRRCLRKLPRSSAPITSPLPTASSLAGGRKKVSYGELIGDKSFCDQARPKATGEGKIAEGLQDRRQVGATGRHPRQGHRPLHLHAGLPRARHAARARGAAAGDRRQARKAWTIPRPGTSRALPRSCARAISSVSSRRANGTRSAARMRSRPPGRNRKRCPTRRSSGSMCAPPRW